MELTNQIRCELSWFELSWCDCRYSPEIIPERVMTACKLFKFSWGSDFIKNNFLSNLIVCLFFIILNVVNSKQTFDFLGIHHIIMIMFHFDCGISFI